MKLTIITLNQNSTLSLSLQINYQMYFEPYVIIAKDMAPRYDEGFVGYHFNKNSYFVELYAAG